MNSKLIAAADEGRSPLPADALVFKILGGEELARLVREGTFAGSADDTRDGFIHLSTRAQVPGTIAKHFRGRGALFVVACVRARLGDALRWEAARGGALFPHLYRPLRVADVTAMLPVEDPADEWRVPERIALAAQAGAA